MAAEPSSNAPETLTTSTSAEVVIQAPTETLTPQDVTANLIANKLPPEQAKAFRANRAAKKAGAKTAAKAEAAPPPAPAEEAPKAAAEPAPEPEAETLTMGDEPAPEQPPEETAAEELTEAELAKLDEKARKRVTEASKEAAKVRKRAQEAEAKIKEFEGRITTGEQQLTDAREALTRATALSGNLYSAFTSAKDVAAWGNNARDALALIGAQTKLIASGQVDAESTIEHVWPNGQKVEISANDAEVYEARVRDAQAWFTRDDEVTKNRESANSIAAKHAKLTGYAEARERYLKDAGIGTKLEELAAKAALYDVLTSRKAVIEFPDTAAAAKSAASAKKAPESSSATRKPPPAETAASTPRLASTVDGPSDIQSRKSLLMEKARNAKTDDERQKFLKEAIRLGPARALARA